MDRRSFIRTTGAVSAATLLGGRQWQSRFTTDDIRSAFPRIEEETYLNAAGMMPLGSFTDEGMQRFLDWIAASRR